MAELDKIKGEKEKDNLVGILAYVTPIGFIIALILNQNKEGKTKAFGAFHLRQALGLFAASLAIYVALLITLKIMFFLWFLIVLVDGLLKLAVIALMVMGVINAANGEKKPLFLIGEFIDDKLGELFEK